ncbi:MAG: hypothetical protein K2X57_03520 [Xanthobacteraceae bacterium]|nr:hypothetical protein [Xanthobacteraceae bacterium]
MAAITFNSLNQAQQVRERLQAVLIVLSEVLDRFVSYRMRLVAAAAEHARPQQSRGVSSSSTSAR